MVLGALLQVLLATLPIPRTLALAPIFSLATYKFLTFITALSSYRPGNNGEILHNFTADFHQDVKSKGGICIFLLGFKSHQSVCL